jgi:predicted nucleic acid-binding protein
LTYLDAYALVALIADEPAAAEVESLIREHDCRVSTINLAETIDVSQRVHSLSLMELRGILGPFFPDVVLLASPQEEHAWAAADIRARYYSRKSPLSLADCFLIAHASLDEDGLATSDAPLAEAARADGVPVTAFPDRTGRRP